MMPSIQFVETSVNSWTVSATVLLRITSGSDDQVTRLESEDSIGLLYLINSFKLLKRKVESVVRRISNPSLHLVCDVTGSSCAPATTQDL